jgi:hypothetical protein
MESSRDDGNINTVSIHYSINERPFIEYFAFQEQTQILKLNIKMHSVNGFIRLKD